MRWLSCTHVPPISTGMSTTTPGAGASQGSNAPMLKTDPVPPVTLGRPGRSLGRRRRLIRGADGPAATRQGGTLPPDLPESADIRDK